MNFKIVSMVAVGLVIIGLLSPMMMAHKANGATATAMPTPLPAKVVKTAGNASPMASHGNVTGVPTSAVGEPLGVQRNITTSMNRTAGQV